MPSATPRNVLFITVDQWRADCLGAAGHPLVRTPVLDRLAAQGTLFRRHFSVATPCGPARASLLTGLYLHNHRSVRNGTPLDRRHFTLPQAARRAGLAPILLGYTDTPPDPRELNPAQLRGVTYEEVMAGWEVDTLLTSTNVAWLDWLRAKGYVVPPPGKAIWQPVGKRPTGELFPRLPPLYAAEHSETAFLTERAIARLEREAVGGGRFLLHVAYIKPHPPFVAPPPFDRLYDAAACPAPLGAATWQQEAASHPYLRYLLDKGAASVAMAGIPGRAADLSAADRARLRAVYYGLISHVDDQIGRLLAALERLGLAEDTVVVVSGDHGEQLMDHHLLGKEAWFDQTFAIPLIIRAPGGAQGVRVADFTESVDVLPTLLDLLDQDRPPQLDGASLRPFLRGESPAGWRREAHMAMDFRTLGSRAAQTALGLDDEACSFLVLRGETSKYVHFAGLPPVLHDLACDPAELVNLAADPGHVATVADHARRLLSWRMAHDDRTLTGWDLSGG